MNGSEKAMATRPGSFLGYILAAFIAIVASTTIIWMEPDAIADPMDELSFGFFTRIFSNDVYPNSNEAKKASTVVLIDKDSLSELGETWPPSYRFHADNLLRIIAAKPKAILIDFILVDDRNDPSLDDLQNVLKIAETKEIPVIVARGTFSGFGEKGILQPLKTLVQPMASWQGSGAVGSPFRYSLIPLDGSIPLCSPALIAYEEYCNKSSCEKLAVSCSEIETASDRLFKLGQKLNDECKELEELSNADRKACNLVKSEAKALKKKVPTFKQMWVLWSSREDTSKTDFSLAFNEEYNAFNCGKIKASVGLIEKLVEWYTGKLGKCAPQTTIPAEYLVLDPDDRIGDALKGRVVFYGFDLEGIQDYVFPPTLSGPVAGVYMHAMAFENLVEWGRDYLTTKADGGLMDFSDADKLEVLILTLFLVLHYIALFYVVKRWKSNAREAETANHIKHIETNNPIKLTKDTSLFVFAALKKKGAQKVVFLWSKIALFIAIEGVVILTVLIATSIYFEMYLMRVAPVNWLAILSFFGLNTIISIRALPIRQRKQRKKHTEKRFQHVIRRLNSRKL